MSLSQLSRLLPLPEEDLQQVLEYAATLSKQEAAEHFNNLLGESPQSIEFISSFNSRRQNPTSTQVAASQPPASESFGVPKTNRKTPKKKAPLHALPARRIESTYAAQGTAYNKKNEDDYIAKRPTPANSGTSTPNHAFSLDPKPAAVQAPFKTPPSASGALISDAFKSKSTPSTRTSSPAPSSSKATKINITGGTSMHGASTILNELDAAIRSLEISTNSTLMLDSKKRACNCIGSRHPLLTAAPNCLNCGKVICVKEGLGPCTFCSLPLLSATEVQAMITELRSERGREKMALDNSSHRRAEISKKPAPFSVPSLQQIPMSPAEAAAKEHRDRLLGFQAQNAKRTTVRDEAADFETPITAGLNIWASPAERARTLKKQQKVLAEQEWNARPDYEKRRQVVSIDLVKGKVMKKMAPVEKPVYDHVHSEDEVEEEGNPLAEVTGNAGKAGAFSRNPLLRGMIKPIYDKGTGKGKEGHEVVKRNTWRRVQDNLEDNEEIILDGGAFGGHGRGGGDRAEVDEPARSW
ncbi:related to C2HC5 finger protein [Rhynchosporium secalis]|uniref:Related to C2HC5 finger protein n=1 Tax=Rhynchosporium secalis TaxID=38038 RepID=A0A1E1ML04_RHYSE|nr:related to C2HC5 finger protein [Rhynchosporium secalis]